MQTVIKTDEARGWEDYHDNFDNSLSGLSFRLETYPGFERYNRTIEDGKLTFTIKFNSPENADLFLAFEGPSKFWTSRLN